MGRSGNGVDRLNKFIFGVDAMQCDVCKHHFRMAFFCCCCYCVRCRSLFIEEKRKSEKWKRGAKKKKETNTHNSCLIVSFHTGILNSLCLSASHTHSPLNKILEWISLNENFISIPWFEFKNTTNWRPFCSRIVTFTEKRQIKTKRFDGENKKTTEKKMKINRKY